MALTVIDTLVDGTQVTKIGDGTDTAGISDVSGAKSLNVSVKGPSTVTGSVSVSGSVSIAPATTATLTSLPRAATTALALAANPLRKGFVLFNDTTVNCFITFGATATTTAWTTRIPGGSVYEKEDTSYTGPVSVIWANAGAGTLKVTDLT